MSRPFVLGVVPYLNAVPLVAEIDGAARLVEAVPADLGPLLERGEVDAALLPVYSGLRGTGDGFVGRYGIVSRGPVASVLLFLRCPLSRVQSLVLDPASRTSAALARYLVAEAAGGGVRVTTANAPGPDPEATEGDAVLVIGDPALAAARRWSGAVLDLGEAWTRGTGLPFVYARWTARAGLDPERRRELARLLDRAAGLGQPRRADHARAWARARGQDETAAARYVVEHVHYAIGPAEEAGLERYRRDVVVGESARVAPARK